MMKFIPSTYQLLLLILIAGIIALQVDLWTSSSGIGATTSLNQQVEKLSVINDKSKTRNNELYDEVVSLRSNNEVIEGLARQDLGLIQKGETFFQLLKTPAESAQGLR